MQIISRTKAMELSLKFYFTGEPCKRGHLSDRLTKTTACVECLRNNAAKWRNENREQHNSWAKNNPDKHNANSTRYRRAHPERRAKTCRNYLINNRETAKAYQRKLKKRLREESPDYRFKCNLRGRLHKAVTRDGANKSAKTMELIGCTVAELKVHLEKQFRKGMNWSNYGHGKGKWNIDHIIPCASFDLSVPEQQHQCFHFTNLRPLWHILNILKADKIQEAHVSR